MEQQELEPSKSLELVGFRQKVDAVVRQVRFAQGCELADEGEVASYYAVVFQEQGLESCAWQEILKDLFKCLSFDNQASQCLEPFKPDDICNDLRRSL